MYCPQLQPYHKIFNNNEDQNILNNENYDKVVSTSEVNEFEKLILWLDGTADNTYLDARGDVDDGRPKHQQYRYQESGQSYKQLNEEKEKFSLMGTSSENAEFNSLFDPDFNEPNRRNFFDGFPLRYLITAKIDASEVQEKEIINSSITSDISKPLYQSLSTVNEKDFTKLYIRDYIEAFTSTLYDQNETQNVNAGITGECMATPGVSTQNAPLNNICIPESFDVIYKENFVYSTNYPASNCHFENFGFKHGENEARYNGQYQTSSRVTCVDKGNEFAHNYKTFTSVNDKNHVASPSDANAKAQRHPQERRFICPFCRESFHRKDYLIVHWRKHTGDKPYACNKCTKKFVTNGLLTRHLVTHKTEKPFACEICKNSFAQKGDITRHFNSHTGVKKYKCLICGKGFTDYGNRSRHFKKIHNKK